VIAGALLLGTVDGANVEIIEEAGDEQCACFSFSTSPKFRLTSSFRSFSGFAFGYLTPQVDEQRYNNRFHPTPIEERSPRLARVFDAIASGMFGDADGYMPIVEAVTKHGDNYLTSNDFDCTTFTLNLAWSLSGVSRLTGCSSFPFLAAYLEAISLVDECWKDRHSWVKKALVRLFLLSSEALLSPKRRLTLTLWPLLLQITVASMGKFGADSAIMKYAEEIWNIEPVEMAGEGQKNEPVVQVQKQESKPPQATTPPIPTSKAPIVQAPPTTQEPKSVPQAPKTAQAPKVSKGKGKKA
jgi:starch phosphorylase